MARIAQFFSYLHSIMLQVPQQQYHNISRLVQPQIRSIANSFMISSPKTRNAIETQVTGVTRQASQALHGADKRR